MRVHLFIISLINLAGGAMVLIFGGFILFLAIAGGLSSTLDTVTKEMSQIGPILSGFGALIGIVILLFALPVFWAGLGLFMRRQWGRMLAIAMSVLDLVNFPVGTIFGIYSLWILFSDPVVAMFKYPENSGGAGKSRTHFFSGFPTALMITAALVGVGSGGSALLTIGGCQLIKHTAEMQRQRPKTEIGYQETQGDKQVRQTPEYASPEEGTSKARSSGARSSEARSSGARSSDERSSRIYTWTDSSGVLHATDNPDNIPPEYRNKVKNK